MRKSEKEFIGGAIAVVACMYLVYVAICLYYA